MTISSAEDQRTPFRTSVRRAAGVVLAALLVSRVLGWLRLTVLGSLYGRNSDTDAFLASFAIPDLLYVLISGGAMTAAIVPVLSEFWADERHVEGRQVAWTIWNMTAAVLVVMVIAGITFATSVTAVVQGFSGKGEIEAKLITYTRILFPTALLSASAAFAMGVLHSFGRFASPAFSWVAFNLVFIVGAYVSAGSVGLLGLCVWVLAASASMTVVQIPSLRAVGFGYEFAWQVGHPAVKKYWRAFLPTTVGLGLAQANLMLVPVVFGSLTGEGGITALNYANRILLIPLGITGGSLAVASFPFLSRMWAEKQIEAFRTSADRAIGTAVVLSAGATMLLASVGRDAIDLVLGHGRFTVADVDATAYALAWFSVGLIGHGLVQVSARVLFAAHDFTTPVTGGVLGLLVSLPVGYVLSVGPMSFGGAALSTSLMATINGGVLASVAARRGLVSGRRLATTILKSMAAAALGFLAAIAILPTLRGVGTGHLASGVSLVLAGGIGSAVFVGTSFLIRADDALYVVRALLDGVRKVSRRSRGGANAAS